MSQGSDLALRVTVPKDWGEIVGAMLMEHLGPYCEEVHADAGVRQAGMADDPRNRVTLVFYPPADDMLSDSALLSLLPEPVVAGALVALEHQEVSRDWVDGWKDHFHAVTIGRVWVRPPWEPPAAGSTFVDVVINPGLGFGTGLHPTTRGTLTLLQGGSAETGEGGPLSTDPPGTGRRGSLVDAGTGSGILAIAAAKLGWGPVLAFDNDGVALVSARENVIENGVDHLIEVRECDLEAAPLDRFAGATVLANMTLTPILGLLRRMGEAESLPARLVVSGLLAGAQEEQVLREAKTYALLPGRRLYEAEWVSMELVPEDHPAED